MTEFTIRNENYASRVREGFKRQHFMSTIGAQITDVGPGSVEIEVPYKKNLKQQHGFFHGGLVGTIADTCGGFAAFSLMAASDAVLTIEYKLNLLAPADGELLVGRGQVLRPGKTVTVCKADVFIVNGGEEKLCATMLGTFMRMVDLAEEV